MLGMEMLLANMLGIKPEEMEHVVKNVIGIVEQAGSDISYIRARLDELHPPVKALEGNDNGERD